MSSGLAFCFHKGLRQETITRPHLLVSENLERSLENIVDGLLAHVRFPL
jgi:hypothetical protein